MDILVAGYLVLSMYEYIEAWTPQCYQVLFDLHVIQRLAEQCQPIPLFITQTCRRQALAYLEH